MIRRWSCLITINNNFTSFYKFKKNFKINVFKTSVNFKKFTFKFTKFKRKALIRIKHQNNFLIYTNVIKFWIKDFFFQKNYLKFQFLNVIFINNFFRFNSNFFKNKNDEIINNFNFIYFNLIYKNKFYFNKNIKNNFFKFLPLSIAFTDQNISESNNTTPLYNYYENLLYPLNEKISKSYSLEDIFHLFFEINFKKIIEIRKILTLFFFFNLNNFKNVK